MATTERFLPYEAAATLLASYEVPLAPSRLVNSPAEAGAAADRLGFPLAVKVLSPQLSHKSDAGLVRLGLRSAGEVQAVSAELLAGFGSQRFEGLLVQKMVTGGLEMIVGASNDPQFGPVIALGSGGVLVELLDDVVLRLPPLTGQQAADMVRATRSWPLLRGYRGSPPADAPALAQLLVNLSRLAVEQARWLVSLDLNPVMVLPQGQGVMAVDLRMVVRHDDDL